MAADEGISVRWKYLCEVLCTTHFYLNERVENSDPSIRAAAALQLRQQEFLVEMLDRVKPVSGESAAVQSERLRNIEDLVDVHEIRTFAI